MTILRALAATVAIAAAPLTSAANADYELKGDIRLGEPNFWDYLSYDGPTHRLYAAHVNKIDVFDVTSGKTLGQIGPLKDAHGIAIADDAGKGYADSGDDGVVKVFSLEDFHILKTVKVAKDADGMVYDAQAKTVLVVAGDSKNLTLIDTTTDTVSKTIALPGEPEFLALDGHGHAFINIASINSVSKVDLSTGTVTATWPLEGCEEPHGIAYNASTDRIFSGCKNRRMIVVDGSNGRNLANLPIGIMSDGVAVDPVRNRAFAANADGTLTIVTDSGHDHYTVQRTLPTFFGGRNLTIDDRSGTLFIAHGNMKLLTDTHDTAHLRFGWDGLNVAIFQPND